jgi:hypothetical protein
MACPPSDAHSRYFIDQNASFDMSAPVRVMFKVTTDDVAYQGGLS